VDERPDDPEQPADAGELGETEASESTDVPASTDVPDERAIDPVEPTADGTAARPWYRPRWKPLLLKLHRWTSFVSMLLVVAFFLSGAIVMYSDDAVRLSQSTAYHSTDNGHTISFTEALSAVNAATPTSTTWALSRDRNVYIAFQLDEEYNSLYTFVDGGTGEVNATLTEEQLDSEGWPWLRRLAWNMHVCALSCPDMPWHLGFMEGEVPVVHWKWKTTALAVTSLATIFLAISGLVVWWPGLRRWRRGFRFRRTNLTTISIDLHRVLGALSIVWFLMWGITGLAFAYPQTAADLWHDVTGGTNTFEDLQMRAMETYATPGTGTEVDLAQAEQIALDTMPDTKVVNVQLPLPANGIGLPENYYQFLLADTHLDPRGFAPYGGGQNAVTVGAHGEPTLTTDDGLSSSLWTGYRLGLHDGFIVNPWWRLIWLWFGIAPLLFAATGLFMWWRRRRSGRLRHLPTAGDGTLAD